MKEGERETKKQAINMIGEIFRTAKTNIKIYHFNLPFKMHVKHLPYIANAL